MTGELSTMCENPNGQYTSEDGKKYLRTFPLFLNSDYNHPNNSAYCKHMFKLGEFLFCSINPNGNSYYLEDKSEACSKKYITDCKNNDDYSGFVSADLHIDSLLTDLKREINFDEASFNETVNSLNYSLNNLRNTRSSTGEMYGLYRAFNSKLKSHFLTTNDRYMEFYFPLYWTNAKTEINYPASVPFVLYFIDKDGKQQKCPVTIRPQIKRSRPSNSTDGNGTPYMVTEITEPSVIPLELNEPKAYRCGNNGQFKLQNNPSHNDTINIGKW
jgi:hypothetical protein